MSRSATNGRGAATLASVLGALTCLTKLELWGNGMDWETLAGMMSEEPQLAGSGMDATRRLHPLLKAIEAAGGEVGLESEPSSTSTVGL
jgi:hypothetical protein